MMSSIRGKETKPELALRRALHGLGFRFRLHQRKLPGRPDIVLAKFRAAVFVHGCFWHQHDGCRYATRPSSRREFWERKFKANLARDQFALAKLTEQGWRVAVVWECALRKPEQMAATASKLAAWLKSGRARLEIGTARD